MSRLMDTGNASRMALGCEVVSGYRLNGFIWFPLSSSLFSFSSLLIRMIEGYQHVLKQQ